MEKLNITKVITFADGSNPECWTLDNLADKTIFQKVIDKKVYQYFYLDKASLTLIPLDGIHYFNYVLISYFKEGFLHREDGPAMIETDESEKMFAPIFSRWCDEARIKKYFLNGRRVQKADYFDALSEEAKIAFMLNSENF